MLCPVVWTETYLIQRIENGIPLPGWVSNPNDECLLDLLPLLDALRFTADVRSILRLRRIGMSCWWHYTSHCVFSFFSFLVLSLSRPLSLELSLILLIDCFISCFILSCTGYLLVLCGFTEYYLLLCTDFKSPIGMDHGIHGTSCRLVAVHNLCDVGRRWHTFPRLSKQAYADNSGHQLDLIACQQQPSKALDGILHQDDQHLHRTHI